MVIEIHPIKHQLSGKLNPQDVAATINGLEGTYASRDLYRRYASVCRDAGRVPATPTSFGRTLAAYGFPAWRSAATRGWHIHKNWIYPTS